MEKRIGVKGNMYGKGDLGMKEYVLKEGKGEGVGEGDAPERRLVELGARIGERSEEQLCC